MRLLVVLLGLLIGPPAPVGGVPLAKLSLWSYPLIPPGQARTAFSASRDNRAYLRATWPPLHGAHTAYYHVYSPDGALWLDLPVPFTGIPDANGVTWTSLPIAGTGMSRMLGTWHVTLTLDTDPTVRAAAPFALTE